MITWMASGVKIGRAANVDLSVTGDNVDQIAYRIHKAIRDKRLLASRDVEVEVVMAHTFDAATATVYAGGRMVGEFTMQRVGA